MKSCTAEISQEEIARRAYEIWQARGCPSGDGSENWQAAEAELIAARIRREGTVQQRLQLWWRQMRQKFAGPHQTNGQVN
jgi:hypothetical protein